MFPATRDLLNPTLGGDSEAQRKKIAEPIAILVWNLLRHEASYLNIRARCKAQLSSLVTSSDGRSNSMDHGGVSLPMIKKRTDSASATPRRPAGSDPASRLQSVNQYLEKNFPDFFAEARFQVGDDDYFLYARFGQYLARTIELNRVSRDKINRGFTVLNKMARVSARSPRIREMLVSGPLEYIVDAPKARALARKRLSPVAQGYLESLCE